MQKIVMLQLPPGRVRDRRQAALDMVQKLDLTESVIYAAFRGELSGKKPFTILTMKRFLLEYYGGTGLTSSAHLRRWLDTGLENYKPLLFDPEICDLENKKRIPPGYLWNTTTGISRTEIEEQVLKSMEKKRVVVLKGPPGVGKSWLLENLYNDLSLHLQFDFILFLSIGQATVGREDWLESIRMSLSIEGRPCAGGEQELKRLFADKKICVMLNNLHDGHPLEILQTLLPMNARILVATAMSEVVAGITGKFVLIEVPPYSRREVDEYLSTLDGVKLKRRDADELARLVNFNPLGLHIAANSIRLHGINTVSHALRQAPPAIPSGIEAELFKPIYLAYNLLNRDHQDAFKRTGAFPLLTEYDLHAFSALWGVEEGRAAGWLMAIGTDSGLFEKGGEGKWCVHEQVWRYAQTLFAAEPSEMTQHATQWAERGVRHSSIRDWFMQEFKEAGKFRNLWENLTNAIAVDKEKPRRTSLGTALRMQLFHPWSYKSSPWQTMNLLSSNFRSQQYLQGFYLSEVERRWKIASFIFIWSCVLLLLLPSLPFYDAGIFPSFILGFLLVLYSLGFAMRFAHSHITFFVIWSRLWSQRRE